MVVHCSTGQSPQWAVVPIEEEEEEVFDTWPVERFVIYSIVEFEV